MQTAGHGYRLSGKVLKDEFDRVGLVHRMLLRYTQALVTQIFQSGACNRHHSIEQQLCRWLLLTLDRSPSGELVMTQELIAGALGVRREGITEAAGKLQAGGLHPLPARPHLGARPGGAGGAHLRVLRRRQDGIRAACSPTCATGASLPPSSPRGRARCGCSRPLRVQPAIPGL